MIITSLALQQFRNYEQQTISFSPGVNVLYGNNAQGKTNILEAIYLFSNGKSHRGVRDRELIRFGQPSGAATLFFEAYERENRAEIELFSDKRKKIRLNGVALNRVSRMIGYFQTVLFCPEDLYLIKGGPGERRRFLDSAICPLKPNYFTALVQYQKILEQKNKLLRQLTEYPELRQSLEIWNEKMCETGARLMIYRAAFLKKLNELCEELYSDMTGGREKLQLRYHPSAEVMLDGELSVKQQFMTLLEQTKQRELGAQMSLTGPHRDEIEFYINGAQVKQFASQGQQRTVVLTMKIAQIELVRQAMGDYPVLLLDDILSELDKSRQSFLMEQIKCQQVIMTCTDAYAIERGEQKSFYCVRDGIVTKE